MEKVTSPDGTAIAYYRSGAGSPLVLVPGTGAANPVAWTAVLPALEEHFSVYAVDRRGHGESGDGPTYAIEREFEDIAAVVDSIEEPANLLGHSFGALCALEAALLTRNLRQLVVYEPALPLPGVSLYPAGVIERLQALLDAGDREGVLTTFYHEVVMVPPHEIEQLRASPAWPARLATAHTLPRETRAEERYTFDAQRFKDLHTPTLLLLGGDSPQILKAATETVDTALPNSRIAVMPGQQHIAMYTAPDLFLHEVLTFLIEPR
ncbi:MAG: alpha/beta hydrolase [Ardenticatenaceae bacterium]|nr:alpha/beta hydrolase [Ardenticatenaceae bacterium]HBY98326.1 alpha/beta hydrolase [Chloroflexota bacterium]